MKAKRFCNNKDISKVYVCGDKIKIVPTATELSPKYFLSDGREVPYSFIDFNEVNCKDVCIQDKKQID